MWFCSNHQTNLNSTVLLWRYFKLNWFLDFWIYVQYVNIRAAHWLRHVNLRAPGPHTCTTLLFPHPAVQVPVQGKHTIRPPKARVSYVPANWRSCTCSVTMCFAFARNIVLQHKINFCVDVERMVCFHYVWQCLICVYFVPCVWVGSCHVHVIPKLTQEIHKKNTHGILHAKSRPDWGLVIITLPSSQRVRGD